MMGQVLSKFKGDRRAGAGQQVARGLYQLTQILTLFLLALLICSSGNGPCCVLGGKEVGEVEMGST